MEPTDIDIVEYSDSEESASTLARESSMIDVGGTEQQTDEEKPSTTAKTLAVLSLAVLCSTCYAVGSYLSIIAQLDGIGNCYLGFFNGVVSVTLLSPYMAALKQKALPRTRGDTFTTVGIGVLGTVATIMVSYTPTVSLGDVTALIFASMPIFTALFACMLGQERCQAIYILATFFSFTGIFLITRPRFIFKYSNFEPLGTVEAVSYSFTLFASFSVSLGHVLGRAIRGRVSVYTIMFFIGVVRSMVCGALFVALPLTVKQVTPRAGICILAIAALSLIGSWCRFQALRFVRATTFALLLNFEVVVSYILDEACFHFDFTITDIIGACLVIVSSGIVAFVSKRDRDSEENEKRQSTDAVKLLPTDAKEHTNDSRVLSHTEEDTGEELGASQNGVPE
ncbi:uncharacterized transporter CKL_3017-like [Ptychodera flava]|uniref:uncharacterized transporter CKL_3017-like n=1 Tax=Ptychodera flava TaxID=63121 RepID=UPI00396A576E